MLKKLTRTGNSVALVLDRQLLELAHIEPDSVVEVSMKGRSIVIAPAPQEADKRTLRKALAWTNKRYGRALRRLAE